MVHKTINKTNNKNKIQFDNYLKTFSNNFSVILKTYDPFLIGPSNAELLATILIFHNATFCGLTNWHFGFSLYSRGFSLVIILEV